MMKFSWAISWVKWLSSEKTNVSKTEMVFKTLVFTPLNHLTQLIAQENFIIFCHRESNKSQKVKMSLCLTKHHAMKVYWGIRGIAPLILSPQH
jgi:hypothetical protein